MDDTAVDPDGSWLLRTHGPGVMLREPAVFGGVYLASVHDEEDLVFVGRRDEAGALS